MANLWTAAGALVSTATFAGETASGWQEATFAPAVPITANTQYVASYHTNAGHYSVTGGYFASAGVDTPPLHALANAASANGVYRYGASGFPTATYNATNYWVDVVFDTTGPSDTTPPTVISNSPAAGATGVAASTNVTATFSEPIAAATVNTSTFELRNSANAIVPATVTYDSGDPHRDAHAHRRAGRGRGLHGAPPRRRHRSAHQGRRRQRAGGRCVLELHDRCSRQPAPAACGTRR